MKKRIISVLMAAGVMVLAAGCQTNNTQQTDAAAESVATEVESTENIDTESAAAADSDAQGTELTVMAAASMTDVLTELGEQFEAAHDGVSLTFNFDSSGTLKTQIENGAPADIFISAALKQMNELDESGFMDTDSIVKLLENKVVLIKPVGSELDITSFEEAAEDKVTMIAIGNEDVPVGQYTETIYTNLGLWDQISAKANLGTNVRQVLDWVATGNVDCGVVYATDAAIEENVEVAAQAPEGSCDPVIYPAGIVKETKDMEMAQEFMSFLNSEEAKSAFEAYGFVMYQE